MIRGFLWICVGQPMSWLGLGTSGRGMQRVALDIKIINALGAGHYQDSLEGPLVAAAKYRDTARQRGNVYQRCAEKGVRYEPLVFTAQGGIENHAEAIISQIADNVAKAECRDPGRVKAEMLETISFSIARSVAKSILRRRQRPRAATIARGATLLEELECLEEPPDG